MNNLDSIVVLESKGKVLVNLSDALHPYPENIIEYFTSEILKKWPKIDYVFCGYGGASYFPNTIHFSGKNDEEVALSREQFFAENFSKIIAKLVPTYAIPFAADYVLLRKELQWTNRCRFSKKDIARYFAARFPTMLEKTKILTLSPGDSLHGDLAQIAEKIDPDNIDEAILEIYPHAFKPENAQPEPENFSNFLDQLLTNLESRLELFPQITSLNFSVELKDIQKNRFLSFKIQNRKATLTRSDSLIKTDEILLSTTFKILSYSIASEWGGDAITIGSGCDIFLHSLEQVNQRLDTVCTQLLTKHPRASRKIFQSPIRVLRHSIDNPAAVALVKSKLLGNGDLNKEEKIKDQQKVSGTHWITRNKCEICKICDLPLVY